MIIRMTALAGLVLGILAMMRAATVAGPDDSPAPSREFTSSRKALQEVQDFIGLWNLEGTQKVGGKTEAWKEKVSWGWKFKDGDAWITVDFAEGKGKYFTERRPELRPREEEVRPHARRHGRDQAGVRGRSREGRRTEGRRGRTRRPATSTGSR